MIIFGRRSLEVLFSGFRWFICLSRPLRVLYSWNFYLWIVEILGFFQFDKALAITCEWRDRKIVALVLICCIIVSSHFWFLQIFNNCHLFRNFLWFVWCLWRTGWFFLGNKLLIFLIWNWSLYQSFLLTLTFLWRKIGLE